ncbi:MAG: site-2 protease family protein [Planctomycetes bacterium]|nr:site-2 protease family protein [Planctomycetota bacterium]
MSWPDRDEPARVPAGGFGRPGGGWQGLRPALDNPLTWSLPAGRLLGIDVRVHVVFVVFIGIELLRAAFAKASKGDVAPLGVGPMGLALGSLLAIVLLHELGHCLACRRAGGLASEILMWPLGGLAFCNPPHRASAHLVTVIGGPLVNVGLCAVLAVALGLLTGQWWQVALPNPFSPSGLYLAQVDGLQPWWLQALFLGNWVSLVLLLVNLLPIFPLDGGRIVQAILWPRMGYARSMRAAVWTGYCGAFAVGLLGFVLGNVMVVLIAGFGGITCYATSRQLAFTNEFMGIETKDETPDETADLAAGDDAADGEGPSGPSRQQRRVDRRARREADESRHVDRILEKIAETGLESLTGREKRLLRRVTQRKQRAR